LKFNAKVLDVIDRIAHHIRKLKGTAIKKNNDNPQF
jgi:hypothetical protein